MRRVKPLQLALLGLAMAAPSATRADLPVDGSPSGEVVQAPPAQEARSRRVGGLFRRHTEADHAAAPGRPRRLCQACAAKLWQQQQQQPTTVAPLMIGSGPTSPAGAGCSACASGSMASSGSTPGYAVVGDPSPAGMVAVGGAPGYAVVGGTIASAEPVPVGVVRTSYPGMNSAGPRGASGAGMGGGPAGPAMGPGGIPYASPNEMPPSLFQQPTPRRHRILGHILGLPDFSRMAADREDRQKTAHAAISYGSPNTTMPTDLPSSLVHTGGH